MGKNRPVTISIRGLRLQQELIYVLAIAEAGGISFTRQIYGGNTTQCPAGRWFNSEITRTRNHDKKIRIDGFSKAVTFNKNSACSYSPTACFIPSAI
jgi:hypothetical protein